MSIGIYKITSPSGKVYIGQSTNIEKRMDNYCKLRGCNNQPRLINSFLKYSIINHKFEIIEECLIKDLNIKERYWQDYYDVINLNGLNCILTNTNELPRIMSQDIKNKIGQANKGKPSCNKGKNLSQSHKDNIGQSNKGKNLSQSHKDNIGQSNKKPVLQFTKEGILINEFNSYIEAKKLTGIDCQFALNKTCKTAKGYIWIYKENWDGLPILLTNHGNAGKSKSFKGRVSPNKRKSD